MRLDARRLEELSLNSSAPPGQLLYDGWILRMLRGKAKRARSVNAVYASTLPLAQKIAYCEQLYGKARMPVLFRITPFSTPMDLDAELAARGYERFDNTAVEAATIDGADVMLVSCTCGRGNGRAVMPPGVAEPMELRAWIDAVGSLRGSPDTHRAAHFARIDGMPLAKCPVVVRENGEIVATGLAILEDDCVGLFDIITRENAQRRGHARSVVAGLLRRAWELGADQPTGR